MSVMNTHAHTLLEEASERSRTHDADRRDRQPGTKRPTVGQLLQEVVPWAFFVPVAGPPVILLFGPWLLLVLLVIPPAAFLITLVLVTVVAAGALVAVGALLASPYLLVRHLRARHAARRAPFASRRAGGRAPQPAKATPRLEDWLQQPSAAR
jgi:hypothetical protein